jgi:hypothetical protein
LKGADIETALLRYPDFADELRPILEASVDAGNIAISAPSEAAVQRNRAKVLQHAAQMREAKAKSSQRVWFVSLRRLAVTLAVLAVLSVSGTGLVQASSTTLPGDNLYPVKRTWEDVLVAFTFNPQQRDALEVEHENERLHELQEVFAEGRSTGVDFAGSVTSQNGNEWVISGVRVVTSAQTEIRDQGRGIVVGSAVRVKGQTQGNGVVSAERIELLPAGAILPDVDDEHEIEAGNQGGTGQQNEDHSGKGSETETPQVEETQTQESESGHEDEAVNDGSNNTNNDSGSDPNLEDNSNTNDSNDSSGSDDNSGSNSNDSLDDSNHNSNDDSGSGGSNSGSDSSGSGGGD